MKLFGIALIAFAFFALVFGQYRCARYENQSAPRRWHAGWLLRWLY